MKVLFLLLGLALMPNPIGGVQPDPKAKNQEQSKAILADCEFNAAFLDFIHDLTKDGGLIIVIGRLGDGETSRSLNQRRLQMVRQYLTNNPWKKPRESVILAEGERVSGLGRVEFYFEGKLERALLVKRQRNLQVFNCAA
jgi:hypothetical protein